MLEIPTARGSLFRVLTHATSVHWRAGVRGEKERKVSNWFEILWNKQRGLCFYCSVPMLKAPPLGQRSHSGRLATKEHRHPRSQGGWHSHKNTVLSCASCNQKKADL